MCILLTGYCRLLILMREMNNVKFKRWRDNFFFFGKDRYNSAPEFTFFYAAVPPGELQNCA